MHNNLFLHDLKVTHHTHFLWRLSRIYTLQFGSGDGLLNYYLYNWRTAPLAGIEPMGETPVGQGVGVVML